MCCFCRYLRAQNSYNPPQNVQGIVDELKSSSNIKSGCDGTKFNLADKFNFLSICTEKFQHPVPNSVLHEINTIGNVYMSVLMEIGFRVIFVILNRFIAVLFHSFKMMLLNFMKRQSIHTYHWMNYVQKSYRPIYILNTIIHDSIPIRTQCLVENLHFPNFPLLLPALKVAKNILVMWLNANAKS